MHIIRTCTKDTTVLKFADIDNGYEVGKWDETKNEFQVGSKVFPYEPKDIRADVFKRANRYFNTLVESLDGYGW